MTPYSRCKTIKLESVMLKQQYDVNMAALLEIGEWFIFFRQNDVYDNTCIVLVSIMDLKS